MGDIAPDKVETLARAVSRAFTEFDLRAIVLTTTGDDLFIYWVGPGKPLRQTAFELIDALNREGVLIRVVAEMVARRQSSEEFLVVVRQVLPAAMNQPREVELTLCHAAVPDISVPNDAYAPGLQKNVRPNLSFLDVGVWQRRLSECKDRVCRIEIAGQPLGTGFLVGPSAVLTNWHVVEAASKGGTLDETVFRFDYLRKPDRTRYPGVVVELAEDGLAAFAPYAAAELTDTPEAPPPAPGELDFALLKLAQPAGEHPVGDTVRGWYKLPEKAPQAAPDAPILILQHPGAAPMKLAMDPQSFIGPNAGGTRLKYRTNTENGSSGAPVCTMDWELIALHHFGDPAWGAPKFNQGVPIGLIRASILAAGRGDLLGA